MSILAYACLAFASGALAFQAGTCALAIPRCRAGARHAPPRDRPGITIVRPVCGLETFSQETLESTFHIAYPNYEILFCVADAKDAILPLLRVLLADHPNHQAKILIGEEAIGDNPKLNNMAQGFRQARFGHVVFVDSNVLTPPDYLDQLMAGLEAGAGMVSAPPVGLAPSGFWAELECAFLNAYQARMQYAIDSMGWGFAQGKTLFFRRADLDHGGLERLASEPAEDAAATKMMQARGERVKLAGPFAQLIGPRTPLQVWKRQVRWARLRRASFPHFFAPEVFAGLLPPLLALGFGLNELGLLSPAALSGFAILWYAPELLLQKMARWPRSITAPLLRDLMLPLVFAAGVAGRSFEWHGRRMSIARAPAPHAATQRFARLRSTLKRLSGAFPS
jgi:ceramide glucosyltransferase